MDSRADTPTLCIDHWQPFPLASEYFHPPSAFCQNISIVPWPFVRIFSSSEFRFSCHPLPTAGGVLHKPREYLWDLQEAELSRWLCSEKWDIRRGCLCLSLPIQYPQRQVLGIRGSAHRDLSGLFPGKASLILSAHTQLARLLLPFASYSENHFPCALHCGNHFF